MKLVQDYGFNVATEAGNHENKPIFKKFHSLSSSVRADKSKGFHNTRAHNALGNYAYVENRKYDNEEKVLNSHLKKKQSKRGKLNQCKIR